MDRFGSFFNPSRPGTNDTPSLPVPPVNLGGIENFAGSMFSGLGGGINSLWGNAQQAAGNEFQAAPEQAGNLFGADQFQSDLSRLAQNTDNNSFFNQAKNDLYSGGQWADPFNGGDIGHIAQAAVAPESLATNEISQFAGPELWKTLGGIEQKTQAPEGGWGNNPVAPLMDTIHTGAALLEGPANLINESPQLQNKMIDAMDKGFKGVFLDKNIGWNDEDTQASLKDILDVGNELQNNILGQNQFLDIIYNDSISQGHDPETSRRYAEMTAPVASLIAQIGAMALTGGATAGAEVGAVKGGLDLVGKAMSTQLALQFASNPTEFINQLKSQAVGGDDPNAPDYSVLNLLKKTYNATQGGKGPSPEEVAFGLTNVAQLAAYLTGLHGVKTLGDTGIDTVKATRVGLKGGQDGLQNQAGTEVNGIPGEVRAPGTTGPAIEGRDQTAVQGSEAPSAAFAATRGYKVPEATNIPNTGTESVPQRIGPVRASISPGQSQSIPLEQIKQNLGMDHLNRQTGKMDKGFKVLPPGPETFGKFARGWILPDDSAVRATKDQEHVDIAALAGYKPDASGAFELQHALKDGWIRFDTVGGARSFTIGDFKSKTLERLNSLILAQGENLQKTGELRGQIEILGPSRAEPETLRYIGNTMLARLTWKDYVDSGFDIKSVINRRGPLGAVRAAISPEQPQNIPLGDTRTATAIQWPEERTEGEIPKQVVTTVQRIGNTSWTQVDNLLSDEHLKYADNIISKLGNNDNGVVKYVKLQPELGIMGTPYMGYFRILTPDTVYISSGEMLKAGQQWFNWKKVVDEFTKSPPVEVPGPIIDQASRTARQYLQAVKNTKPRDLLVDILNHEITHAQIMNMSGSGPVPFTKFGTAAVTIKFHNLLRSTPEGQAWLEHSGTIGLDGQIEFLDQVVQQLGPDASGATIAQWLENHPNKDLIKGIIQATSDVEEAFDYQIQRHQGINTSPYLQNSGEETYAYSFWYPEEIKHNASLAGAFWDRYGPRAQAASAGSYPGAATSGATPVQLAGINAAARFAASTAPGDRGPTPTDQRSLAKDQVETDILSPEEAVKKINTSMESLSRTLEAKLAQIPAKGIDMPIKQRADSLEVSRQAMESMQRNIDAYTQNIKNLQKKIGPAGVEDLMQGLGKLGIQVQQYRSAIYNAEIDRLPEIDWRNKDFKLRDVALEARTARNALAAAQREGVVGQPLKAIENNAYMAVAKFISAYETHNSPEVRGEADYKPNRQVKNLTERVANLLKSKTSPEVNPGEFAASAIGLTVKDALNNVRDAKLGLSPTTTDPRHDPRNWHDSFIDALGGTPARVVADARKSEAGVATGFNNIPLSRLLEPGLTVADILKREQSGLPGLNYSRRQGELATQLIEAKRLARTKAPGSAQKVKQIQEEIKVNDANWKNYQRKLNRIKMNNPDVARSLSQMGEEVTPEEEKAAVTLEPEKVAADVEQDIADTPSGQELVNEINQLNQKVNMAPLDPVGHGSEIRLGNTSKSTDPVRIWSPNYAAAHEALISIGGTHADLARAGHSLLRSMAAKIDPARNNFAPARWFRAFHNFLSGIDYRVAKLRDITKQLVPDEETSKRILRPIEVLTKNPARAQQLLSELTPNEQALSRYFHELWDSTGNLGSDPERGLLKEKIMDFAPHIVKTLPDGTKLTRGVRNVSRFSEHQLQRVTDAITKLPIFETLQDLENEGYEVEWDLSTLLDLHLRSSLRAINNRDMLNYHTTLNWVGNIGHGDISAPPVIRRTEWNAAASNPLYKGISTGDKGNYRTIRYGPYAGTVGDFFVLKPMADEMEKLAKATELGLPGGIARGMQSLTNLYKFNRFAVNPLHLFSVATNTLSAIGRLRNPSSYKAWAMMLGRAEAALKPEQAKKAVAGSAELTRAEQAHMNARNRLETLLSNQKDFLSQTPNAKTGEPDLQTAKTRISQVQQTAYKYNQDIATAEKAVADTREALDQARGTYDNLQAIRDSEAVAIGIGKGLPPDRDMNVAADYSGKNLAWALNNIPGLKQWHHWMWHDVIWKAMIGTYLTTRDALIKEAARSRGYQGKSVIEAENMLSPEEVDRLTDEAVYQAKSASGLWNQIDHSMNTNIYGRAGFLSMSWTMGQAKNLRDIGGSNVVTRKLGREDLRPFGQKQAEAGYTPEFEKWLDDQHTRFARRMIFGGMAKALATAFVTASFGSLMLNNGKMQTPVDNFMVDPVHTFDTRIGTDPATGKPIWLTFPLFRAQTEIANYALTAVKGAQEKKNPLEIAGMVGNRLLGKLSPAGLNIYELIQGVELGKQMSGIPNADMSQDNDIASIHRALNSLGVPDLNGLEDRLIYAIRSTGVIPILQSSPLADVGVPQPVAVKRDASGQVVRGPDGKEIPLTDPASLLNDFLGKGAISGIANMIEGSPGASSSQQTQVNWPSTLGSTAAYTLGSSITQSSSVQQELDRQTKDARYAQTKDLDSQLTQAAASGDWNRVKAIQQELGLTPGQTVSAITHGVRDSSGNYVPGMINDPSNKGTPAATNIDGVILNQNQQTEYEALVSNRDLYVLKQLQNDPQFKNANQTEKSTMINNYIALADRVSKVEYAQKMGLESGVPVDDTQFQALMRTYGTARDDVINAITLSPSYKDADPGTKQRMLDNYMSLASTFAYDKVLGIYKNMDNQTFNDMLNTALTTDISTKNYLQQSDFYHQSDPGTQARMENEYSALSKKIVEDIYSGKIDNVAPPDATQYIQSVINTEESSKFLLHQTDFYQAASLTEQSKLDTKYQNLARTLASKDWQRGTPLLDTSNIADAYTAGPEKIMLAHMIGEQGFRDMQQNYGGTDMLASQQAELAAIHKQIAETTIAPPKTINYLKAQATNRFYAANPNYAAYVKARTIFERNTSVGRMYAALNADEQALANSDLSILEQSLGIDTTMDTPTSIDPATTGDITAVDAAGLPVDVTGISIDPTADLTQLGSQLP